MGGTSCSSKARILKIYGRITRVVRTHFNRGTPYGEQWYPVKLDRAYYGAAVDRWVIQFRSVEWGQDSQDVVVWECVD
jgi:hypothetical protein